MTDVVIDARFRGPDSSANGGYACGVFARAAGLPAQAEVTLRLPPPLGVPLRVENGRVLDGDALVAELGPAVVDVDPAAPPAWEDVVRAEEADIRSPFPNCFVCGHARAPGDGLRIHAGPLGVDGRVAAAWRPRPDTAGAEFAWAALDCPGAYAVGTAGRGALVLGRLAARIDRAPEVGERCVVVGWAIESEGRKHVAGTALYAGEELLGAARAVWIEPRQDPAAGSAAP